MPLVLMVAEKPSIAQSIASVLGGGRLTTRRKRVPVHEFPGTFEGRGCDFRVRLCMSTHCYWALVLWLTGRLIPAALVRLSAAGDRGDRARVQHGFPARVQQLGRCRPPDTVLRVRHGRFVLNTRCLDPVPARVLTAALP